MRREEETGEERGRFLSWHRLEAYCSVYTLSPVLLPFSLFDIFMQIWAGWCGSTERINSFLFGLSVTQELRIVGQGAGTPGHSGHQLPVSGYEGTGRAERNPTPEHPEFEHFVCIYIHGGRKKICLPIQIHLPINNLFILSSSGLTETSWAHVFPVWN